MKDSAFQFDPIIGYWFVACVGVLLLALLWLGPERARTTPRQRLMLAGLRALVILVVLAAMLRPARVVTEMKELTSTLLLVVDRSRSMQVADAFGGKSRWEVLNSQLADAAPLLADLGARVKLKAYAFDAQVQGVDIKEGAIDLGKSPEGEMTAMGAALEEVLRRESGERLLACILLGDGAQRAYAPYDLNPRSAVRGLVERQTPLHTFTFGEARGLGQARDATIVDLIASPTVFVKNQLDVTGTLRVDGYPNREIPVELLFETQPGKLEVVAATRLPSGSDGQQLPIALNYLPQVPGEYKYTLRAAAQEGELVVTNNELSGFVTVLKGGLNVLYLAGGMPLEQSRVGNAIDASQNIQLDRQYFDRRTRSAWPIDAGDWFKPGRYDVYVLSDLDAAVFKPEDWTKLAACVERGAGLIMLGGPHSFGAGGFRETALADVLPVVMGPHERQRYEDPIRKDLHENTPLTMIPANRAGPGYSFLQLAAGPENAKRWQALPPLDGANKFERLKPGADVIASAENAQGKVWPLLVAGSWGGGRVLAFAGDSTWRWPLAGFEKEHRRFWRQLILWLAHVDESTDGNVWVKLDERRFRPGGRVTFTVGADTAEGEPIPTASFKADMVLPDGTRRPLRLTRQGERMTGTFFETRQSGDYAIEVTASNQGGTLGNTRARFLVFEQDLELDNPSADPDLLASLAAMTAAEGGRAWAAEQLPELLRELAARPREYETEAQTRHTYWDKWPLFLIFITLLTAEWYLRKKWGLV